MALGDTGFMAPRGSSWVSLLYVRPRVIDTDEKTHSVASDVLVSWGFFFFLFGLPFFGVMGIIYITRMK